MIHKSNIIKLQSTFLLIIFIALKLDVVHVISHVFSHDDIADCDHCIFILDSNQTNSFNIQLYTYESSICIEKQLHKPIILLYKSPVVSAIHILEFFNKPPPFLV